MKRILIFILKIPYYICKYILKCVVFLLKHLFVFLFGWIPDLNDQMSGYEFEEYVREVLIRNHFDDAELTKKSGDFGIDILASYKGYHYAIQCKMYHKPVGVAAVQQAYAGCKYYQCDFAVVVTNTHFTRQAIELAQSNGVQLWDGTELKRLKNKANARSLLKRQQPVDDSFELEYKEMLVMFLNVGYASEDILMNAYQYSEQKSYYILKDLEFMEFIGHKNKEGIHELYYLDLDEAREIYNKNKI